ASDATVIVDAGCDANFAVDPFNCGSCGHNCSPGTCAAGTCAPGSLATGQGAPFLITADTASIYWSDGNYIRACSKSGCPDGGPIEITTRSAISALAVAFDNVANANTVFWSEEQGDAGGVFRCPTGGCDGGEPTHLADGLGPVASIAFDTMHGTFYFA